ncbi:MAG: methionyl-tRNA formyltransferase [Flavobacteriales bacterium]|jgi:methionyl-tRNA formyltransferase
MKILLLANKDIASNLALNHLFKSIGHQHQFQIFLTSHVGKHTQYTPQKLVDLAFFEQHLFNEILFPARQNNTTPLLDKYLSFNGFKTLGVKVSNIHAINCQQGLKRVNEIAPDLIVSIRFGLILQSAVIKIPKFGVINLHSGELPTYRGVMATFRAMQQGDTECGTSLHYISDSGIDRGEIISISRQSLDYQRSYLFNTLSVYKQGIEDVVEAITKIENTGKCESYSAHSQGNYFSFPCEQELIDFQKKGLKLYEHQDIIDIAKCFY